MVELSGVTATPMQTLRDGRMLWEEKVGALN